MKRSGTILRSRRALARVTGILLAYCSLLAAHAPFLSAQNVDSEVRSYLVKIENGQSEQAKSALPDLMGKYPNNPGVVYLQGKLTPNGIEAAKMYQSIVDNFPKSEWADDALFALYRYYYALGLYKTADLKLQQLRREYPGSPYATGKQAREVPYLQDEVVKLPTKEVAPAETTRQSVPEVQPVPEPYTLQVGAYSTLKNAEKQKTFFEDLGVNVEITNKVRGGRSLYLVWAGSFTSSDEAKAFGRQVRQKYKIDSIVVEKY